MSLQSGRAVYPSLAGKRVLITGGASGIGASLVEAFAAQGSFVGFVDIAERAGHALEQATPGTWFRAVDLRNLDALGAAIAQLGEAVGGTFDVLVNNAASDDRHAPGEVTPAYWDERMATNLRHFFFAAQAVMPGMRACKAGAILNFGSVSWHRGLGDLVLYETAKAGIEGMTRALARELGPDGVRVNTIIPGSVQTPRQERWYSAEGEAEILADQCLKVRIQPSDVAALVLFLASDDARMCTGHEYWVDAGWL